jgi:xanthine dehydrogenase accessory factor
VTSATPAAGGGLYDALGAALRAGRPVALATVLDGPGRGAKLVVFPVAEAAAEPGGRAAESRAVAEHRGDAEARPEVLGSLGDTDLDRVVVRDALGELAAGTTVVRHYGLHGEARESTVSVFVESFAPPPRLIVFGAVDFTGALVRVGKVLGFRVTVCDAREVFATRVRFPDADEVIVDWPDRYLTKVGAGLTRRDAVCVLTHDAKFDVPALVAALATDAGYIGAMGSRRTHAERVARLADAGIAAEAMARVHAPIGLDLGARTPEETAVSICAEIIALRTGRTDVRPLSATDGPIHAPPA